MELVLDYLLEDLIKFLKKEGFHITQKRKHYSAIKKLDKGRLHVLFAEEKNKVFCEIHFDKKIHAAFLGVDYEHYPKQFFDETFLPFIEKENLIYETNIVSWFKRKNKAIFTGFRIN